MTSVLRGSVLATYGLGVQGLARLGYTVYIGREMGAQPLGILSAILALSVFLSLLWPMGCSIALSVELAASAQTERGSVWRAYQRDAVLSSIAAALVAGLLSLPFAGSWEWASGAALLTLGYCCYVVVRGAQLGLGGYRRIAVADTVFCVVTAASAGVLWLADGLSVGTALLPLALAYVVSLFVLWPKLTPGKDVRTSSRRFVAHNAAGQVATGGLLNVAMLGAQVAGGARSVGLFAAAFSLATPASMVGQSLNQVLIPTFAARPADQLSTRQPRAVMFGAALALGLLIGALVLIAPFLLALLYGDEFADAVWLMRGMLVGVLIFSLSLLPAAWLIARRRSRDYVRSAAAGFLAGAVLILVLGVLMEVWGVVVGYSAGAIVTFVMMFAHYRRSVTGDVASGRPAVPRRRRNG